MTGYSAPLALALLGGCGVAPERDGPIGALEQAYKSKQGEQLQATSLGSSWVVMPSGAVSGSGLAFTEVYVERAELRAKRGALTFTGAQLNGARLRAKSDLALPAPDLEIIVRAVASHGAPGEFEYRLEAHKLADPGDVPFPLCNGATTRALPVTGTWTPTGAWIQPGPGQFSFACEDGVIVKCIDWGYKPWANWPAPVTPLRPFHQSCTRLARADYCSNGNSFTLDGTPIDVYDRLPLNTPAPAVPGEPPYVVESIWGFDAPTGGPALKCLSKKRWDTIPFGGACPLKLPDPRVDRRNGIYCEEKTWAQWQTLGAIIANDSIFIDKGLFRWRKTVGSDHYSTTQYISRGLEPSPTGPPPGGYQINSFEGAVYADDLSGTLLPAGALRPLYSYFSPSRNDYFTTTATDPNTMPHPPWDGLPLDYAGQTPQGYIYQPPPALPGTPPHPRARLLFSWYSPSRREHVTSREKPMPAINPDYVMARIEGWVLVKQ